MRKSEYLEIVPAQFILKYKLTLLESPRAALSYHLQVWTKLSLKITAEKIPVPKAML
jgi:hypothetical protein